MKVRGPSARPRPSVLITPLVVLMELSPLLLVFLPVIISAVPAGSSSGMQQQQQQQQHTGIGTCPSMCECPGEYYVYCQSAGLQDHHVTQIISQISASVVLLDLSANQINTIQPEAFKRLPNLQYLYLSANQIEELPTKAFRCLFSLKQLALHQNRISAVYADSFFDLIRIQNLDLSENDLTHLPHNTFTNLKTLEKLHLQHNSLSELQTRMFYGLDSLEFLNISHNSVLSVIQSDAFMELSKLKTLDLSHNALYELSASSFNGLTALSVLDLGKNFIGDITFLGTTDTLVRGGHTVDFRRSLTDLSLASNNLQALPTRVFPSLPSLKRLDLSNNSISDIGSGAFTSLLLDKLSLRENVLTDLERDAFIGVQRISELDLGQNQISGFTPGVFDSFRRNSPFSIDISENRLAYIHAAVFREMDTLRLLNLSRNQISVIDPGALDELAILEELDLSGNRLALVTPEMVLGPARSLRRLKLLDNPLEEIRGFSFYHQTDHIVIETEAKVGALAANWAIVSWPYRDGSQLYWSLLVTCASTPSSSHVKSESAAGKKQCQRPPDDTVLEPFRDQVNVSGLSPDTRYTVCVLPVFVSTDVMVRQCVRMRTKPSAQPVTPVSVVDDPSSANYARPQTLSLSAAFWSLFVLTSSYGFL